MKLQLKRSNVLDGGKAKEPTAPYVEYGELCVNYNTSDPALFIKDSNDNIIRIAGKHSVGSGSNPSGPNNPSTGNNIGDVFFNTGDLILYYWDGNEWVPIASQKHAADIYVGTFAEVDVEIPEAERRNGLLLWETEEGNLFLWYIDADTSQWVVAVPGGGGGGGDGANVAVLDVAPNDPDQGDLWYCTLDGRLYIYYQDTDTSQWVDASPDNLAEGFWERDGTTLKPIVAGDDVDLGSGDLSANSANIGGGNITLRADGTATFGGIVRVGIPGSTAGGQGAYLWNGDDGSTKRSSLALYNNQLTGNSISISSAADETSTKTVRFTADCDGTVKIGTDVTAGSTTNITLNPIGTGMFANSVSVGESGTIAQNGGVALSYKGVVTAYVPSADYSPGSPFGTVSSGFQVASRDIAEGAGDLYVTAQWRGDGSIRIGDLTDSQSANLFLRANGDIETQRGLITSGSVGVKLKRPNATQTWDIITSSNNGGFFGFYDRTNSRYAFRYYDDGTSGFSGTVSIEDLELATGADDPSNFSVDQEYTGPTLNVKDRILNLVSRLDALEANEVIDDATDTSLLTLLASASARLDSIEVRLTALEGGN